MKIVTFDEIVQQALKITDSASNRRYVYRKYVRRLIEAGKLQQIRKGLYGVLSPLEKTEEYIPDKILIASKIRKNTPKKIPKPPKNTRQKIRKRKT